MVKKFTSPTIMQDIYGFLFNQSGLMAGLGIDGAKITRICAQGEASPRTKRTEPWTHHGARRSGSVSLRRWGYLYSCRKAKPR